MIYYATIRVRLDEASQVRAEEIAESIVTQLNDWSFCDVAEVLEVEETEDDSSES